MIQIIAFKYVARCLCMSLENYHSINQHIHYFFEKEQKTLSDPNQRILERSISPLRIGKNQPIGELDARTTEADVLVPEDKGKKRVSFSDDSSYPQTPNGSCNVQKRKYSSIPGNSNNNNVNDMDTFEEDFFSVLNKLHGTIER